MRPGRENIYGALCHLCNIVPVWGLIFCGGIWFAMREESRRIVDHARQAMVFHGALLLAALVWLVFGLVVRLLSVIAPALSELLKTTNNGIMTLIYAAYVVVCIAGCVRTASDQPFRYPLVRNRP